MAPLRNTKIIPANFVEHHAAWVLATMTAEIRLSRPGRLGERNTTTGKTPVLPQASYYHGPGRAQIRGASSPRDSADRLVTVGNYLIVVPVAAGVTPRLNDRVEVIVCYDDEQLTGLDLVVVDVPMASIILQRNLGADLQTATNP